MSRRNHKLLLHLLLLLVTLSPLRGFAMPQTGEPAMQDCQQMQMSVGKRQLAQQDEQICEFCQSPGCDDGQCNMALCGAFHTPVTFLAFAGIPPVSHTDFVPAAVPGNRLPDRNEPPLIRPPICIS